MVRWKRRLGKLATVVLLCGATVAIWGYYFCAVAYPGGACLSFGLTPHQETSYRPDTGIVRDRASRQRQAPLKIVTAPGNDYLIKFSNSLGAHFDIWIYIRGGETFETRMPLGVFTFRYASGRKWGDYDTMFGSGTVYQQADRPIDFTANANSVTGHTIELIGRVDGNLHTRSIRESDF